MSDPEELCVCGHARLEHEGEPPARCMYEAPSLHEVAGDLEICDCLEFQGAANLETPCPKREDLIHCDCWWEGEGCCSCGAPAMTEQQKRDQGMIG